MPEATPPPPPRLPAPGCLAPLPRAVKEEEKEEPPGAGAFARCVSLLLAHSDLDELDYLPAPADCAAPPLHAQVALASSASGGHCLGLPWALLPSLHAYARSRLRECLESIAREDGGVREGAETIAADAASVVLLCSPFDHTAWNARKAVMEARCGAAAGKLEEAHEAAVGGACGALSHLARLVRNEQRFCDAVLSRHAKASECWAHRGWLVEMVCERLVGAGAGAGGVGGTAACAAGSAGAPPEEDARSALLRLLLRELAAAGGAAARRPRNYRAWTQRLQAVRALLRLVEREAAGEGGGGLAGRLAGCLQCMPAALEAVAQDAALVAAAQGAAPGAAAQGAALEGAAQGAALEGATCGGAEALVAGGLVFAEPREAAVALVAGRLVFAELRETAPRLTLVGDPSAASYRGALLRLLAGGGGGGDALRPLAGDGGGGGGDALRPLAGDGGGDALRPLAGDGGGGGAAPRPLAGDGGAALRRDGAPCEARRLRARLAARLAGRELLLLLGARPGQDVAQAAEAPAEEPPAGVLAAGARAYALAALRGALCAAAPALGAGAPEAAPVATLLALLRARASAPADARTRAPCLTPEDVPAALRACAQLE